MVDISLKPYLINGQVMHRRFYPKKNYFKYKSSYISFPLSKILNLKKFLFSLNKFNLFSIDQNSYQYVINYNKKSSKKDLYKILDDNNINNIKEIILVTHPKVIGYVFNPVSFWLCIDNKNYLKAVLCEVSNNYDEKHSYLCFHKDFSEIKPDSWLESKKVFHVSPFFDVKGFYKFKFEFNLNGKMNFFINYFVDNKLMLSTYLKCSAEKFDNKNLLKSFFKIPIATFKTIILIYYQAFRLYLMGIKFRKYSKKH